MGYWDILCRQYLRLGIMMILALALMTTRMCGLILCSVLGIPINSYSLMRDHTLPSFNCEDCRGLSFVYVNVVCGIN